MSILLTGGSGFIGSYLSARHEIFKFVVRHSSCHQFESVHEIKELSALTCWQGAFTGVTSIIHLAGLAHSNSLLRTIINLSMLMALFIWQKKPLKQGLSVLYLLVLLVLMV